MASDEFRSGKVKWYSKEKGHGFIATNHHGHEDYFFHISSIKGSNAPEVGDLVHFHVTKTNKKHDKALQIEIVKTAREQREEDRQKREEKRQHERDVRDERLECKHCGKKMVPRLKFENGEPVERICPFCMSSQEGGCFIATATFNSESHPTVETLRKFRDAVLLDYSYGRKFVSLYYKTSPNIANWIKENPISKPPLRIFFNLISYLIRLVLRYFYRY